MREAIPYFEKAASLLETDYHSTGMLQTCYAAVGDKDGLQRAAQMTLDRTQKVLAQDPSTGSALGFGATALAALGDRERTREWVKRAMLMDPENITMRWNLTCALSRYLEDVDGAIDLLESFVDRAPPPLIKYLRLDPDLDPLRSSPRFETLVSDAEKSLAQRHPMPPKAAAAN